VEKIIRLFVITPHLHRVHHSTKRMEMNSNFGFSVSWWDYLFGSLRLDAKELGNQMDIGLKQWRQEKDQKLWNLLRNPFLADQKDGTNHKSRNN
jgi:sterol desaturase/sphingolipid hydroxylase (fatty acid hydroxylase superfamily)